MLLALAAGLRPRRCRLGSTSHRRMLLPVIPAYAPPQSPSPPYSVPIGARLTWSEPDQTSAPSHHWQHHYPHSAAPPSEPGPRFPPLRLVGHLPPESVASSFRRQVS